ncbi:zinc ribbon domain-containing protein [Comamonas endophytica]|uniref:zinc ribbon domain-containing protein n=1 Tax=Comamonas endophytica TaxID=2949090 RepID=UPI0036119A95
MPVCYTSQTCPHCGHVSQDNRRTQAAFMCQACGHGDHADVVGAINVLERGLRLSACGGKGSGRGRKTSAQPVSVKPEPTEATVQELQSCIAP